jgi:hypothetical protein
MNEKFGEGWFGFSQLKSSTFSHLFKVELFSFDVVEFSECCIGENLSEVESSMIGLL